MELNYHLATNNNLHVPKQNKAEDSSKPSEDKHSVHKKEKTPLANADDAEEEDVEEEESDSDSEVDLSLGLSDEEYSDEEEYTMVVRYAT